MSVLEPPDPEPPSAMIVGAAVGTVASGAEDSTGATVLTTVGVETSLPPAAEGSTGAAVDEDSLAGAAAEVAGVELLTGEAGVEGVELSTGAADDAGVVDPPAGATPHEPRGLVPGKASKVPEMVSSIADWMLQEVEGSLSPPMRPGHLSIPESPASQLSMICCKVAWSHPEIYEIVS